MNLFSIVCLNVKELLAWSNPNVWSLSDNSKIRIHNHLVHKSTLNQLAKLAKWSSCVMNTYLYGVIDCIFLSCHLQVSEWIYTLQFAWISKSSLTFRQTIECSFTLKLVRDMIIKYSQIHLTDKYWQQSSTIWPVWPVSIIWTVFFYELSGYGFESRCCHLNFRYGVCFEQRVPWHSGKL